MFRHGNCLPFSQTRRGFRASLPETRGESFEAGISPVSPNLKRWKEDEHGAEYGSAYHSTTGRVAKAERETSVATILILDAERDSRRLFKRFLEQEGHAVIACEDQRHALDLAIVNADAGLRNTTPVGQLLKTEIRGLKILVITDFLHEECKQIMAEHEVLLRPVEMETVEARVCELLRSRPPKGP